MTIPKELELPLATEAVHKVIAQGCETHPGEQTPWPPDYSDYENLRRMQFHLNEYMHEGKVVDEHGMDMLAKVVCRGMFILERQGVISGKGQGSCQEGDNCR